MNETHFILYTKIVLFSLVAMAIAFCAGLYIYDPLQVWHKPVLFPRTYLNGNMREAAAGIINNHDFDSIIMGNSYSENTSAKEATELFGGKFFNLSLSGSNLFERNIVIQYFLSRKKAKIILSQADAFSGRTGHQGFPVEQYKKLYDANPINDLTIYLNQRYMQCLTKFSSDGVCVGRETDFDRPNKWYDVPSQASRFGGIEQWIRHRDDEQLAGLIAEFPKILATPPVSDTSPEKNLAYIDMEDIKNNISDFIVTPAKANPQTLFLFFDPPVATLSRSFSLRSQAFSLYRYSLVQIIEQTEGISNIKMFGFANESLTDDIAYYKDSGHYNSDVNSLIMHKMADGQNVLNKGNIEEYLRDVEHKARTWPLVEFVARFDENEARNKEHKE